MSEITTMSILDGLTLTLHKAFPNSHVHDDEVTQNLIPGDFTVVLITSAQQQIVGTRYKRRPLFDVLYYPKTGKEECYGIADRLYLLLELITIPNGDKVRGTGMTVNIIDNILHFQVCYLHIVREVESDEPMETLFINQGG